MGGTLSLTSGNVTTALGFTPYDASNPDGYTSNTGTVTSASVTTANGVSGSVATATTTPAITLVLGAITPTSVAASGTLTGSNLSGTNTGDNAANSAYANDYRAANFVAGTDYLSPTGSAALLTSFPTLNQNTSGNAATATVATNIASGAAWQIPYQTGSSTTSFITAPSVSSTFLQWNGSAFVWAAAGGGSPFATDISVNGLTIGRGAGNISTNTALGASALVANTTGTNNVAVGNALATVTTGSNNIGIGNSALPLVTIGSSNIGIGYQTLNSLTNPPFNIVSNAHQLVVGWRYTIDTVGTTNFVALGAASNTAGLTFTATSSGVSGTGTLHYEDLQEIAIGDQAGALHTSGAANTMVGYQALNAMVVGQGNAAFGYKAGANLSSGVQIENFNTAVGSNAMSPVLASTATALSDNVAVGAQTLGGVFTPSGSFTVPIITLVSTVAVGSTALGYTAVANGSTAIGYTSMGISRYTLNSVAIGSSSARNVNSDIAATAVEATCTYRISFIGTTDFTLIGAASNTVGLAFTANSTAGLGTGRCYPTAGDENTSIGYNTLRPVYAKQNVTVGNEAMGGSNFLTTSRFANIITANVAIGYQSSYYTAASENTAVGRQSMFNYSNGTVTAGSFVSGCSYQIATIGTTDFTLIGAANNNVGTVFFASGVGTGTGTARQTGLTFNVAVGSQAGYSMTSGRQNAILGGMALGATTSNGTTAIGYSALSSSTTSLNNTVVGAFSGSAGSPNALTTGSDVTYIGANTVGASATETNSIVIGSNAVGYGTGTTVIGTPSTTSSTLFGTVTTASGDVASTAMTIGVRYKIRSI